VVQVLRARGSELCARSIEAAMSDPLDFRKDADRRRLAECGVDPQVLECLVLAVYLSEGAPAGAVKAPATT
jgi:hypothetical protein